MEGQAAAPRQETSRTVHVCMLWRAAVGTDMSPVWPAGVACASCAKEHMAVSAHASAPCCMFVVCWECCQNTSQPKTILMTLTSSSKVPVTLP